MVQLILAYSLYSCVNINKYKLYFWNRKEGGRAQCLKEWHSPRIGHKLSDRSAIINHFVWVNGFSQTFYSLDFLRHFWNRIHNILKAIILYQKVVSVMKQKAEARNPEFNLCQWREVASYEFHEVVSGREGLDVLAAVNPELWCEK